MNKIKCLFLGFLIFNLGLPCFADEPLLKINTPVEDLPHEISDLDDRIQDHPFKAPYEVVLVLANDLGPGPDDDFGYTHGLKIIGATKFKNGIRLRLSYSTDLYATKIGPKDAEGLVPQYFMDENLGKFIVDNMDAGNTYYWKVEAGWHQLNNIYEPNPFSASTQQLVLHKLVNPVLPQRQILNVSEGYGRQNGVVVGGSLGLQKTFEYKRLKLRPQIEAGVSGSTLKDSSHSYASLSLEATFVIKNEFKINALMEGQAKLHAQGVQYSYFAGLRLEGRSWFAGAGVYVYGGDIDNHMKYNLPNNGKMDPINMIFGAFKFGGEGHVLRSNDLISR